MTAPIETAYLALASGLHGALVAAGFLDTGEVFELDPAEPLEPSGDVDTAQRWAALVKVQTQPVRSLLGTPGGRWVVERSCRLELAAASPDRAWRVSTMTQALTAVAGLVQTNPTLGGMAERFRIDGREDDDFPPNGERVFLDLAFRVRSGDPLGLTP